MSDGSPPLPVSDQGNCIPSITGSNLSEERIENEKQPYICRIKENKDHRGLPFQINSSSLDWIDGPDNHPIYPSERLTNGPLTTFLNSRLFTNSEGTKTYKNQSIMGGPHCIDDGSPPTGNQSTQNPLEDLIRPHYMDRDPNISSMRRPATKRVEELRGNPGVKVPLPPPRNGLRSPRRVTFLVEPVLEERDEDEIEEEEEDEDLIIQQNVDTQDPPLRENTYKCLSPGPETCPGDFPDLGGKRNSVENIRDPWYRKTAEQSLRAVSSEDLLKETPLPGMKRVENYPTRFSCHI